MGCMHSLPVMLALFVAFLWVFNFTTFF